MATLDEPNPDAGVADYGDVIDMAVKVPTLSGIFVALMTGTFVWAWRRLRRRVH